MKVNSVDYSSTIQLYLWRRSGPGERLALARVTDLQLTNRTHPWCILRLPRDQEPIVEATFRSMRAGKKAWDDLNRGTLVAIAQRPRAS